MTFFAVLDGELVVNTIVADSQAIAEEITGKTCVEFTTEDVETGGTYIGGVFTKKKPYPSWVLDEQNNWQAPVPRPELGSSSYTWDEASIGWVIETL